MTIQSDRWIREQALEHGMIEPFVEGAAPRGVHFLRPVFLWV
jgi:dCTP deaminase